ncbi:MAG: triose-phosphate isomerase [bacterium]|nr:triose-phosphate isomerase [bacterium]
MKSLIVANWKMNPTTFREAKALFEETKHIAGLLKGVSVVVCPPAIFLRDLAVGSRKGRVSFGLQNVHFESRGSFTGEISVLQAKDAKATYVIVGHAERRAMGETNDDTRKKVDAVLSGGMTPILCVGEKVRDHGADHFAFVRDQLRTGLSEDAGKKLSKILIAYEPVWAIGATKAMEPRQMHEMSIFIRKTLVERFGETGHSIKILYGGAVDATNAGDMLRNGDVVGLLVGRASVDVQAFTELLRAVSEA